MGYGSWWKLEWKMGGDVGGLKKLLLSSGWIGGELGGS
jgi:hypothetical protein